ncbi:hypothetical protein [Alicyclobacillus shizuokensis]|uniref:hypothetical protein n=1 Tax=Alicyclobacillus shizuokensis TaxID=392014 RepID=UPI0008322992|nr:hypothetical protein [Alicyclobacillus shizuokensis]
MSDYLVVLDSEYAGSLEIQTGNYDETGYPEFQDIDPTDLVIGVFQGTEDEAVMQAAKYWQVDPAWLKTYRLASS